MLMMKMVMMLSRYDVYMFINLVSICWLELNTKYGWGWWGCLKVFWPQINALDNLTSWWHEIKNKKITWCPKNQYNFVSWWNLWSTPQMTNPANVKLLVASEEKSWKLTGCHEYICHFFFTLPQLIQYLSRHCTKEQTCQPHGGARGEDRGALESVSSSGTFNVQSWLTGPPTDWHTVHLETLDKRHFCQSLDAK